MPCLFVSRVLHDSASLCLATAQSMGSMLRLSCACALCRQRKASQIAGQADIFCFCPGRSHPRALTVSPVPQLALDNALAPYFEKNFGFNITDAGNLAATFGMLSAPRAC